MNSKNMHGEKIKIQIKFEYVYVDRTCLIIWCSVHMTNYSFLFNGNTEKFKFFKTTQILGYSTATCFSFN